MFEMASIDVQEEKRTLEKVYKMMTFEAKFAIIVG